MAIEDFESSKLVDLARRLTRLTRAGKIQWEQSSADASFLYSTNSTSVVVTNVDADGRHPYLLEVFDGRGAIVDSLRSGFNDSEWETDIPRPWNDLLEELWVVARRSATNVDEVLNRLLEELPSESDDPWGTPQS